jgi:hypothetical protein
MNAAPFLLILAAITALNMWTGWRWTKLDRNPWVGRPLGGMFSGMARPGMIPARLSVAQINSRGWQLLYGSPIAGAAFALFFLYNLD